MCGCAYCCRTGKPREGCCAACDVAYVRPEKDAAPNVTIPADVAKDMAAALRNLTALPSLDGTILREWADLLDPPPPSLREQVLRAVAESYSDEVADAVLSVVADAPIEQILALVGPRLGDWLAAQPLYEPPLGVSADPQRDHDVRLICGGGE